MLLTTLQADLNVWIDFLTIFQAGLTVWINLSDDLSADLTVWIAPSGRSALQNHNLIEFEFEILALTCLADLLSRAEYIGTLNPFLMIPTM